MSESFDGEIRAANKVTDEEDSSSFGSDSFWTPADYADRLHLVATQAGREIEVETRFGLATPAIADILVVFSDDRKEWQIFKDARVFPVALRRAVLEGGVMGGTIIKDVTKTGNPLWLFGDLTEEDGAFIHSWAKEHLLRTDEGTYEIARESASEASGGNDPDGSDYPEGAEPEPPPDEEPF